ncbi:hypothetical protein KIW84_044973 [Lathyrus oleraceus]|uniref:DUF7745 domain-containing protein n=1 Tax=Pisum sativum TaxID=3888 RepID=A0A9D5AWK6_PEA|nr:hypothetical protein KIW84_044973 [Pisum sativum]
MRHPSEHVSPVRTTSTLMSMPDRLHRPRMRYPAESVSFVFLCLFQPMFDVCLSSILATVFLLFVCGSRRVRRMRRGANTFPSHNRLPIPFSLVARPCLFQVFRVMRHIPILDQLSFSGLERVPSSQEIADLLRIDESIIGAHMTTKGGIQGLPSDFLIVQATMFGKAMSEDAFEAIFVLLIYGLVLFPNIDKFVDVNAIRIFSTLNLVPTMLGDTYFSLHMRNAKGGGTIVCCLPLLYKWFISHLPQTLAFKENK